MINLIMGSTGAGKTTFSKKLAKQETAIIFSIDHWIEDLFGADKPDSPTFEWYMERISRIEKKIWKTVLQLESQGVSSVLDLGFTLREHRKKFIELAQSNNIGVKIYYLDIPKDIRWGRVQERNTLKGETFVMEVTKEMFNFMEERFEAPSSIESTLTTCIRNT